MFASITTIGNWTEEREAERVREREREQEREGERAREGGRDTSEYYKCWYQPRHDDQNSSSMNLIYQELTSSSQFDCSTATQC